MNASVFQSIATEHGLNTERVEQTRPRGLTTTTLVQLLIARPANEVDAMLIPLTLGQSTAADLAGQAAVLGSRR